MNSIIASSPTQTILKYLSMLLLLAVLSAVTADASSLPGLTSQAEPSADTTEEGTTASSTPNPLQAFTHWVLAQQRSLHRSLSNTMAEVDADGGWAPVWALISLSFFYGIFHAAGPGHGKAVITTYMLTQPTLLRRGLLLSVLASLMQGVTAIILVLSLVFVLGWLAREAVSSVSTVEQLSFGLVAVLGLVIVARVLIPKLRHWRTKFRGSPVTLASGASMPAGNLHSGVGFQYRESAGTDQDGAALTPLSDAHHHHHDAHACPSCGKAHHVAPQQLKDRNLTQSIGLVLAVGARPCAGAVLVLVVANLLGLWWAGILAVVAMSVGTAITVASLALLAVSARGAAQRLLKLQGNTLARVSDSAAILGGLILFALGTSLLMGSISLPVTRGIL